MSDKVKHWHRRKPKQNDKRKRVVPLRAGGDRRIVPLTVDDSRVIPMTVDEHDHPGEWDES